MPRVIINKTTGRVGEFQDHASKGTLLKNIASSGEDPRGFEERVVTVTQYKALLDADPTRITEKEIEAEEIMISKKVKEIAASRDRKAAVTALKAGGKSFKHFDVNGNRK